MTLTNSKNSYIFEGMSDDMKHNIEHKALLYFDHNYGISTEKFLSTPNLNNFFYYTSISYNLNGT